MHMCKDCKYYQQFSFWKTLLFRMAYQNVLCGHCNHPDLVNEITGKPNLCSRLRIRECMNGCKFEAKVCQNK
jgi:hypothetical protein